MVVEEIIEEIRSGLKGDIKEDMIYLRNQGDKYSSHESSREILNAIGQMSLEVVASKGMPEEQEEQLNIKINMLYDKALGEVKEGKVKQANATLKAVIDMLPNKELGGTINFSFANVLELWLYVAIFDPKIKINQIKTDNSSIYNLYGFTEAQSLNVAEAIKALEESIRWNPVNVSSMLELAEINRRQGNDEKFVNIMRNCLNMSLSSENLARCYYEIGVYYIEKEQYDIGICLLHLSNSYCYKEFIVKELEELKESKEIDIDAPSEGEIKDMLNKYQMPLGPSAIVVGVIKALAENAKQNNATAIYDFCKDVFKDLTRKELEV
ncbi:hypothetical protein KQI77_00455 [Clostridium sp. MSJ-8]|uniref:tetratricopeptide repeat protein n=1 Tax=Clostridium sp. MSJ-8 TaxID=2841510 RepID=UPI001C0EB64A|nr:hypothetical protein [Clostridium sp. MSJ-8]MBU5486644.1 hypothetical protein [Clostridium sp. MSJ-8]